MERGYLFLTSGYRVILALVSISILWSMGSQGITEKKMIMAAIFGGYALVFSIFGNKRVISYLEWLVVLILAYYTPALLIVYFLLLMPFLQIISLKAKFYDFLYLAATISIFEVLIDKSVLEIIAMGCAVYVAGYVLNLNFSKISVLEKMLKEEKQENESLLIENSVKTNQIEVVSKLFIHKQHLDDINNVDTLVEQMLVSSMDYFNAYYVTIYYYKDGIFHQISDKGDKRKYDVPVNLSLEKGKEVYYDSKVMRVPITYEKKPWGAISVYGKRSRLGEDGQIVFFPFEESDFEILSIYVDSVMSRLKEIRRNDKLKRAALYDRLTTLPNRAYIEGDLYKEKLIQMKNENKPFAVLLLDIDHFKSFNDTYGHSIGDEVLRVVARVANETLNEFKEGDAIGRWGGEEFMAFLVGTPEQCAKKAEMVRHEIEKFPFKYRNVTVSIGLAFMGKDGSNLEDISKKADAALYYSKENGRNRVTVYKRGME
ncbi:GGDEF domain-containing protein [Priestia megaterium]|uniref:GGDEF domain-containing protein n=1 Tax=Priestia megaterium TaxID=1404 RepID=UPI002E1B14B5|nr:GGDEF domain-containing protein [Priestia megaterium]